MEAFKSLALVLALISTVCGQNCGILGVTNSTISIPALNETTVGGVIIWSQATYNVSNAGSVPSPQVKYIEGFRYSAKYEYVTSNLFPEFIQSERTNTIRRDVVFTCADGKTKNFTFVIPVVDKNTESPIFNQLRYNATASRSSNSTEPLNAQILVSDADLELRNAQLVLRSSNAFVTPYVTPTWNGSYPETYIYRMDLLVNSNLTVGQYQIILTADDGKFSDFASLNLTITP